MLHITRTFIASLALLAAPALALAANSGGTSGAPASASAAQPGELGGRGLALRAAKVLTVPLEGQQFIDNAVVLVKDGKIDAVGSASSTAVPAGYDVVDLGEKWLMPGMIVSPRPCSRFDVSSP